MEHPLLIPRKYLLLMAVFGFLVILFGAVMKISHWNFGSLTGNLLIDLGIVFSGIAWIVVITDIIRNRNRNTVFWVIGMFLFGSLTTIFYLIKRKE